MSAGSYKITRWVVSDSPIDESGALVVVSGRPTGILSALFNHQNFVLAVTRTSVHFSAKDGPSDIAHVTPCQKVTSISSGHKLPRQAAVVTFALLEMLLVAGALSMGALPLVLVGQAFVLGVSLAVYFGGRKLTFSIRDDSGEHVGFACTPGTLDGYTIDKDALRYLQAVLEGIVLASMVNTIGSPGSASPPTPGATPRLAVSIDSP